MEQNGKAYPVVKIEALKGKYYDFTSKYADGGSKLTIPKFSENLDKELKEFTEKLYYGTKCKVYARIDYLIKDDKAYFMEVNTLPGLTSHSLLPKSLASCGMNYSEVLDLIIKLSLGE